MQSFRPEEESKSWQTIQKNSKVGKAAPVNNSPARDRRTNVASRNRLSTAREANSRRAPANSPGSRAASKGVPINSPDSRARVANIRANRTSAAASISRADLVNT